MRRAHLLLSGAFLVLAASVQAQDLRTPRPLGSDAMQALQRVIDSARTNGLPTKPLYDKVREGVLKGADEQRIILAVQSLAREMAAARQILGGATDLPLLSATASAIHAGVSSADLKRIVGDRSASAPADSRLIAALVVLVDVVAKKVPVGVAASAINDMLIKGAPERQIVALRAQVEQDIAAGRSPESALMERTRANLKLMDVDPLRGHPITPLSPLPPL